ncbi:MAG: metalloregulator ArsR/SmtB family transcription factor [Bacillota bacterium]|nr:metalloregulator ArsR/SmtB family transcription factor [Bacillota bacterium]
MCADGKMRPDGWIGDETAPGTLACVAHALSSPTRLKILKLVQAEELCVCELAALLGVSQPATSQHLAKLRQAGLVTERRAGTMALYREAGMRARVVGALQEWLDVPISSCPGLSEYTQRLGEARAQRGGCLPEPR